MSVNRFEEQVREKMDELRFSPSSAVWSGVEAELDRRRKRRFIYWWLAPAAAIIIVGSLYLNNHLVSSKQQQEKNISKTSSETKQHIHEKSSLYKVPVVTGQTKEQTESTNRPAEPKLTADNILSRPVNSTPQKSYIKNSASPENINKHIDFSDINVVETESSLKFADPGGITRINHLNEIKADRELPAYEKISAPAPIRPLRNWSYGFSASAGVAGVYDRNLIRQTSQAPSSSMMPPNFTNITYRSAVVEPGTFYSVGAFLERPVSRDFMISSGLNYTRYTSYLRVGTRINEQRTINPGTRDSSRINYYYSPDPKFKYKMVHSMLEIPVTVKFSKKWFSANAGVTGAAVITSDMLVFDPVTGIYYKDRDNMNRFMFGLTGGFEVSLFKRSKHPLQVGPVVRYQVSDITSQYTDSRHLLSGALQAKWYLQK
jgi:hypothetical protein